MYTCMLKLQMVSLILYLTLLPEFCRHRPVLARLTTTGTAMSYYICALNDVIIGALLIVRSAPAASAGYRRPNPRINGGDADADSGAESERLAPCSSGLFELDAYHQHVLRIGRPSCQCSMQIGRPDVRYAALPRP